MENISKVLLIAAGMFLTVLLVSVIWGFYNDLSAFHENKHKLVMTEQTQEFNARFENYNRKNIRGNELISLMNRVIDYNAKESYFEGTNYERIKVTITLGNAEIRNKFKYPEEDNTTSMNDHLSKSEITNVGGVFNNWKNDRELIAITNTPSELIQKAKGYDINDMNDTKLQKLASGISNIVLTNYDENDEEDKMCIYARFKRQELIEDILGIEIDVDEENGKTKTGSTTLLQGIKEIASQYYQYMQFKRAHFDCTEMIYDPETGRVVEMNFQLQTKNGNIVFDP